MKKLFTAAVGYKIQTVAELPLADRFTRNTTLHLCLMALISAILFTGCKKQDNVCKGLDSNKEFASSCQGLTQETLCELLQAREATAKYLDINNAFSDDYEDISVQVENMGDHFRKLKLVDSKFDIRKPELLVYSKTEDGKFELGAVEYAVPIELSPNAPPEGFTGSADVWVRDEDFGLWLLHAWVWKNNPDGVFNPTNPLVHVH